MITYNNSELPEGVKVLDIRRPLLPPQLNNFVSIGDRDGSYFYNKRSDVLTIEMDILFKAGSMAELRGVVRNFAEFLHADSPKVMVMKDEPDRYVESIIDGSTDLENFYKAGKGTITMIVPNPYYYAIEDDVYTFSDETYHTFTRQGNVESMPIIEIEAENTDGNVVLDLGDKTVTFSGTINQGEKLIYNVDLLTGYIEDSEGNKRSAVPDMDTLDLPLLEKGENSIRVSTSGGAELYSYTIRCQSRWI